MNYTSITDKPFINTPRGPSIRICAGCLAKKYTNEPPAISRAIMVCPCCNESRECQEIEKRRLQARPPKKRTPKPIPVMVQFNIFKRQIVVK